MQSPLSVAEVERDTVDVSKLADVVSGLGYEVVDVAGFLDLLGEQTKRQLATLQDVTASARQMTAANASVMSSVKGVSSSTTEAAEAASTSIAFVRQTGERTQTVATWVNYLGKEIVVLEDALKSVQADNDDIAKIAAQVNILAINASIESTRAGDAGRGFAVIASAVNELSRRTAAAAVSITGNINTLKEWSSRLREGAETVSADASAILNGASDTDAALTGIATSVTSIRDRAAEIVAQTDEIEIAGRSFEPAMMRMGSVIEESVDGVHEARERVNLLIDRSEAIVQGTAALGSATPDSPFIDFVRATAADVSAKFGLAIQQGDITLEALFDQRYTPIEGSDPVQYLAPYTRFTDRVLPPFQEAALEFDPKVVFCAAVDRNGYLPTHNLKFSRPQSGDPVWNAANCRNRRIFDDRVGLKAGRNTEPFLLQVYRRDMGGGEFVMMKDLSAPIMVRGRHWGGLRFAYKF